MQKEGEGIPQGELPNGGSVVVEVSPVTLIDFPPPFHVDDKQMSVGGTNLLVDGGWFRYTSHSASQSVGQIGKQYKVSVYWLVVENSFYLHWGTLP